MMEDRKKEIDRTYWKLVKTEMPFTSKNVSEELLVKKKMVRSSFDHKANPLKKDALSLKSSGSDFPLMLYTNLYLF